MKECIKQISRDTIQNNNSFFKHVVYFYQYIDLYFCSSTLSSGCIFTASIVKYPFSAVTPFVVVVAFVTSQPSNSLVLLVLHQHNFGEEPFLSHRSRGHSSLYQNLSSPFLLDYTPLPVTVFSTSSANLSISYDNHRC